MRQSRENEGIREKKKGGCCRTEERGAEDEGLEGSSQRSHSALPGKCLLRGTVRLLPVLFASTVQCQQRSGRSLVSVFDPRRGCGGGGGRREGGREGGNYNSSSSQGPVGMGSIRDDGAGGRT